MFFPEVLSVDLILPFICVLKLLPSQGDPKTCIPVHLWPAPPLIVPKTEEPFSKAKHGVRDAKSSSWGPGAGSGIVLLLCLEGFLLPAQKELLFKSKEYIKAVKENNTSKVNGTHTYTCTRTHPQSLHRGFY